MKNLKYHTMDDYEYLMEKRKKAEREYTEDMDWRDYGNDIQQSTRTRLKDDMPETKELSLDEGVTMRKRIG